MKILGSYDKNWKKVPKDEAEIIVYEYKREIIIAGIEKETKRSSDTRVSLASPDRLKIGVI